MVLTQKGFSKIWVSLTLVLVLLMAACGGAPKEESRWDKAQNESTGKKSRQKRRT